MKKKLRYRNQNDFTKCHLPFTLKLIGMYEWQTCTLKDLNKWFLLFFYTIFNIHWIIFFLWLPNILFHPLANSDNWICVQVQFMNSCPCTTIWGHENYCYISLVTLERTYKSWMIWYYDKMNETCNMTRVGFKLD